jgi:hypothetical protein
LFAFVDYIKVVVSAAGHEIRSWMDVPPLEEKVVLVLGWEWWWHSGIGIALALAKRRNPIDPLWQNIMKLVKVGFGCLPHNQPTPTSFLLFTSPS